MENVLIKSFVHGNAVVLQFPGGAGPEFTAGSRMNQVANHAWTDQLGERQGPGAVFRGQAGNTNFFHVCIPAPDSALVRSPTPIIDEQGITPPHFYVAQPAVLVTVDFDVTLDRGVEITSVSIFDGRNSVAVFTPSVSGIGTTRISLPSPRQIQFGLGVSFGVTFNGDGNIAFHSAAAQFMYMNLP